MLGGIGRDLRDRARAVDGVKQALPPRVDRQIQIGERVIAIDEYGRRARGQALAHGDRVG